MVSRLPPFFTALAAFTLLALIVLLPECTDAGHKENLDCCDINESLLWKNVVQGLDPASSARLKPLLDYKFLAPEFQLRAGLDHYGASVRLRKFASDLMSGVRPLKVGVIGGSISFGSFARVIGVDDWFSLVTAWLSSVSKTPISGRNGCIPATKSSYFAYCLQDRVDEDVDLVFIEFAKNDGLQQVMLHNSAVLSIERVVRRVLELPHRPAVVLVQVPLFCGDTDGSVCPFSRTPEDLEGSVSAYYDIPSVSSRTVHHLLTEVYPTPGFNWNVTFTRHHPGNSGHKVMADLAVHLIQTAALDVVQRPLSAEEELHISRPLPEPMYGGNLPPSQVKCMLDTVFKAQVISADGWVWVNEGTDIKPKKGYISETPGVELYLVINSSFPNAANYKESYVMVYFLKSYERMGMARIDCYSKCTCDPIEVDALWTSRTSEPWADLMSVSQLEGCVLRVTLLNKTSSDGHKFKVTGLVYWQR